MMNNKVIKVHDTCKALKAIEYFKTNDIDVSGSNPELVDANGGVFFVGIINGVFDIYGYSDVDAFIGISVEIIKLPESSSDSGEDKAVDHINPSHYKNGSKEVIDMMVDVWGKDAVATHCSITAFKYRMRLGVKEGQPIERDFEKALWYENKAKELRDV